LTVFDAGEPPFLPCRVPRRVHELMRKNFPPVEPTRRTWELIHDVAPRTDAVAVTRHLSARDEGFALTLEEAPAVVERAMQ
jgi:hypothetical protein